MKFFTSDLHFNHNKIIDFCPNRVEQLEMDPSIYSNYLKAKKVLEAAPKCPATKEVFELFRDDLIKNHNECLVQRINKVVNKRDILYIIGDFAFGSVAEAAKWLKKLNGNKILILGNHDRSARVMLEMGFQEVFENHQIYIGNGERRVKVYLSHFPFFPTLSMRIKHWIFWRKHPDKRYLYKRIVDTGQVLLHGHTHDKFVVSKHNKRQIHVGIDAWGEPVSEIELLRFIKDAR